MLFRKKAVARPHERRLAPRRAVSINSHIIVASGRSMACTAIDLSESGARLTLKGGILLPERFSVAVPASQPARPVRLVWRSSDAVGVQFVRD